MVEASAPKGKAGPGEIPVVVSTNSFTFEKAKAAKSGRIVAARSDAGDGSHIQLKRGDGSGSRYFIYPDGICRSERAAGTERGQERERGVIGAACQTRIAACGGDVGQIVGRRTGESG